MISIIYSNNPLLNNFYKILKKFYFLLAIYIYNNSKNLRLSYIIPIIITPSSTRSINSGINSGITIIRAITILPYDIRLSTLTNISDSNATIVNNILTSNSVICKILKKIPGACFSQASLNRRSGFHLTYSKQCPNTEHRKIRNSISGIINVFNNFNTII